MTPSRFVIAHGRFEAARRLPRLPPQSPAHGLHGHGFEARLSASAQHVAVPAAQAVQALRERLAQAMQPLQYSDLNALHEHPDDAWLADWLVRRSDLPQARLELRSTPTQGVCGQLEHGFDSLRRYRFLAAHFLPNVPAGHQCGRLHGHAFEVELRAARTDHATLDGNWQALAPRLEHSLLNDIDGLHNPTSEMLAAWIWQRLHPELAGLRSVTVLETASSGARFDGSAFVIWKEFNLDCALRVRRAAAGSAAARLHGQTFRLRLRLSAPLHQVLGWVVDYGDVKSLFRPLFERLDHQALQQVEGLEDADTCSVAAWVFDACRPRLPALCGADLLEADGCGAALELPACR